MNEFFIRYDLVKDLGYAPSVEIEDGVDRFVKWYIEYFNVTL